MIDKEISGYVKRDTVCQREWLSEWKKKNNQPKWKVPTKYRSIYVHMCRELLTWRVRIEISKIYEELKRIFPSNSAIDLVEYLTRVKFVESEQNKNKNIIHVQSFAISVMKDLVRMNFWKCRTIAIHSRSMVNWSIVLLLAYGLLGDLRTVGRFDA